MTDVRVITESDWGMLRDTRLCALRDAPHAFTGEYDHEAGRDEQWWRAWLRRDVWLLAFHDRHLGGPAGMASVSQGPVSRASDPYINSLWVNPRHRRKHIGRRLVEAIVDMVVKEGAEAVSLWVLDGNHAARALYQASGFVHTGERQLAPGCTGRYEERMLRRLHRRRA